MTHDKEGPKEPLKLVEINIGMKYEESSKVLIMGRHNSKSKDGCT